MKYNIGIIGLGYVGSAVLNAFKNENIFSYDINGSGTEKNLKNLTEKSDIIFLCVPTPMNKDGSCSIEIVKSVLIDIQSISKKKEVVIKSTVPPGTCDMLSKIFPKLNLVFNPEFLTEANFNEDFLNQDRIILSGKNTLLTTSLYKKYFPKADLFQLKHKEAEMVKYFSNCFLALKVSFANEIHSLCLDMNINYEQVMKTASTDQRIGPSHLNVPGPDGKMGFGGSCFPKDVSALLTVFFENKNQSYILKSVWERNKKVDRPEQDWKKLKGRSIV